VAVLFKAQLLSIFQIKLVDLNGNSSLAFYFVASYILGHFANGVGAFLMELVQSFGRWDIVVFLTKKKQIVTKATEIMDSRLRQIVQEEKSKKGKMKLQNWVDSIIQIKHLELFCKYQTI
jgi:hypothetical protein